MEKISSQIHTIGFFLILLSISLLFFNFRNGSDNLWQAIITALAGVYFGLFQPNDGWKSRSLIIVGFVYLIFIILEYYVLGLPEPLFQNVRVHDAQGRFSIPGVLNYLSPWIYLGLKVLSAGWYWLIIRRMPF